MLALEGYDSDSSSYSSDHGRCGMHVHSSKRALQAQAETQHGIATGLAAWDSIIIDSRCTSQFNPLLTGVNIVLG